MNRNILVRLRRRWLGRLLVALVLAFLFCFRKHAKHPDCGLEGCGCLTPFKLPETTWIVTLTPALRCGAPTLPSLSFSMLRHARYLLMKLQSRKKIKC